MNVADIKITPLSILKFALPFILANISHITLQVSDRIMMGWYNIQAANEISIMFRSLIFILFTPTILLSTTAMLAGKYNGAKKYHKTSNPIWQGIWITIVLGLIVKLLSYTTMLNHILPNNCDKYGLPYAKFIIRNAIIIYLPSVLSGFFYAIGHTYIVNYTLWLCNLSNIALNYIFIFLLEMGSLGAAYATIISSALQVIILIYKFLKSDEKYHTTNILFDFKQIKKILYIGSPSALGNGAEMLAWHYLSIIICNYGPNNSYMKVLFFTSLYQLPFRMFRSGIEKAIASISANIIGAKKINSIKYLISTCYKIYIFMILIISILGYLSLDYILYIFNLSDVSPNIYQALINTTIIMGIMMFFGGISSIYSSILTALHDTKFIMQANMISVWCFCVLPSVLWTYITPEPIYNFTLYTSTLYTIIYCIILYIRYTIVYYQINHKNPEN